MCKLDNTAVFPCVCAAVHCSMTLNTMHIRTERYSQILRVTSAIEREDRPLSPPPTLPPTLPMPMQMPLPTIIVGDASGSGSDGVGADSAASTKTTEVLGTPLKMAAARMASGTMHLSEQSVRAWRGTLVGHMLTLARLMVSLSLPGHHVPIEWAR